MSEEIYDIIIVGAGPGGYVAAIRAAQLGMRVVVVEKRASLGGACLNEGCIPSKALLDSSELFVQARDKFSLHGIDLGELRLNLSQMQARKDEVVRKLTDGVAFLFKKNKITWVKGTAKLSGSRKDGLQVVEVIDPESPTIPQLLNGKKVLLATGSEPIELPLFPFDGETVVSARESLAFDKVPDHLLVIGGGYIGLELGSVWRRLGSQVTVIEMLQHIIPSSDGQVSDALMRSLKKQGVSFRMGSRVVRIEKIDGKVLVAAASGDKIEEIMCDKVLVAVGRRPMTSGIGLEGVGVAIDESGHITVNYDYQTSVHGIYAIGDLIHGPMLAHKAMEEGIVCIERLVGQASQADYLFIPGICYTWPEVAGVGKTEDQLKESEIPYSVGRFNFMGNGRARCMEETEGFVKVLAHAETGRVLGVHIIGPRASDMIAEAVTVMSYGGSVQDISMTFHAHPTLSEAIKEAALDVERRAIHS